MNFGPVPIGGCAITTSGPILNSDHLIFVVDGPDYVDNE